MTTITFIMPIRHPAGVRDPRDQQRVLAQSLRSASAQDGARWRLRVVCNREQRLPDLPDGAERVNVDFPPVPRCLLDSAADIAAAYAPFNLDRGRRIQAGLRGLGPDDVIMPLDDDDFVSRRLAAHLAARAEQGGSAWLMGPGYVLRDGAWTMRPADADAYRFMGSSVAARLSRFPGLAGEAPTEEAVRDIGDHGLCSLRLQAEPEGAEIVPFPAVVYRVEHGNQLQADVARFRPDGAVAGLLPRPRARNPLRDLRLRLRHGLRNRPLHPGLCREFFGGPLPPARGPRRRTAP